MKFFRSLTFKLALAFLFVGVIGAVLVAVIVQYRTRDAFNQFIFTQEQQSLAKNLEQYYQDNGSWQGVGAYLQPNLVNRQARQNGERNPHGDWRSFTLVI